MEKDLDQATPADVSTEAHNGDQNGEIEPMVATATAAKPSKSVKTKVETKNKPENKPANKTVYPAFKTDVREVDRTRLRAVRDNVQEPIAYEKIVPLALIVGTDNPRQEPHTLAQYGYKLVDSQDQEHSLLHMTLSDDIEVVRQVVNLFEEHENDPEGYADNDQDVPIGEVAAKSIVGLARQYLLLGQLQPVVMRASGKGEKVTLVFGQRRTAASIYLAAKSKVDIADGVEGAIRWDPTVRGLIRRLSDDEAYDMAVSENFHRKDMTPLQEAAVYTRYLDMVDAETGKKKFTLKQLAQKLGINQGHVRSYAALLKPRNEKTGKGLTDEDRKKIVEGKMTVTAGVRKALNEKHYNNGEPVTNRAKPIPLREMHRLFDNTADEKKERRTAIAECMGVTLEDAIKQSEERINEAEQKQVRKLRKDAQNKEGDDEQEVDTNEE